MRKTLLVAMLAGLLTFGIAALTHGAETSPEASKLKVKVGPFFIQESEKKINLEGTTSHVVRKGKRINITVTVENYGKEKSEPVRLRYVETDKKAGEPRSYRVESIEPGKKWQRTFMARWNESGRKSVTATLLTLEGKPLADEKGKPRPETSHTGSVNLTVKER
ncbi:MAG: CARDB domain-containing protein [Syntrophaceae bacterium]